MTTSHGNILEKGSRLKKLLAISATALIASVAVAVPSWAAVKDPRNLEVDYSRDFVLLEGYPAGADVRVQVFRGADSTAGSGVQIGDHTGTVQAGDPSTLEVNHGGAAAGDCWVGSTPDIQPGDKVVTTLVGTSDTDYTFVRDLTFNENADGSLTGRALGNEVGGEFVMTPLELTDPDGEAATGDFLEGKRVTSVADRIFIFAPPAEGGYDAATGNFTSAVLPGGAGEGEVTLQYVKAGVGEAVESTVAAPSDTPPEDLAPAAGCPAKAENTITSVSPGVVNAASAGGNVTVGGVIQDDVTVALTLNGAAVSPVNVNRDANTFSATFAASRLNEGNNSLTATFGGATAPPAQTRTILKDTVAPVITASPGPGAYNGPVAVALRSNGGEQIRYSTDGNPPNASSRVYDGTRIPVRSSQVIRAFSVDAAGNRRDASFSYVIRNVSSVSLNVSSSTIGIGQRNMISGIVRPSHSGRVTLTIRKPGADLVRNLPLRGSRFSFNYKPPVAGRYTVSVRFAGDADHRPSSASKSFRVIR